MNPLTQFKKILILPLAITLALAAFAAPGIARAAWTAPARSGQPARSRSLTIRSPTILPLMMTPLTPLIRRGASPRVGPSLPTALL